MSREPLLFDSVTESVEVGAGRVVVTGSHGGISSGRFALQARPALVVFNDAGIGLDEAGVAALPLLQGRGIAACTVAYTTARIGEARSTLATGVISRANDAALALGLRPGRALREALSAASSGS